MECNQITYRNSFLYKTYLFLTGKKVKKQKTTFNERQFSEKVIIPIVDSCENVDILNLFKKLKPFEKGVSVYLHGSWADDTNNSFSDIDDFIILNKSKFESPKEFKKVISTLNKIDMKFCRLDPIQHHGHWIVCEEELESYNNSFMPLYIMGEAKKIIGKNHITANIDEIETEKGLKKNLAGTCKNIERLSEKYFSNTINSYELKGLIGSFVLIPAFIFQLKQKQFTKPEAISHSNKLFSIDAITCIEWATECRKNWNIITNKRKYKNFGRLAYICFDPHLWRRFSTKFSPMITERDKIHLSSKNFNKQTVHFFVKESLNYLDVG